MYLDREKNWRRRKIKESIYINAINPTESMVHQEILNLEKGYDFDPIWSGFNKDFRSIIEKKIQFTKIRVFMYIVGIFSIFLFFYSELF